MVLLLFIAIKDVSQALYKIVPIKLTTLSYHH